MDQHISLKNSLQKWQHGLICNFFFFLGGGYFWIFSFYVRYLTLLHLPSLRFHYVGGCWDRNLGQLWLQHWLSDALTTLLDLIHKHCKISSTNSARSHPQSARSHCKWTQVLFLLLSASYLQLFHCTIVHSHGFPFFLETIQFNMWKGCFLVDILYGFICGW